MTHHAPGNPTLAGLLAPLPDETVAAVCTALLRSQTEHDLLAGDVVDFKPGSPPYDQGHRLGRVVRVKREAVEVRVLLTGEVVAVRPWLVRHRGPKVIRPQPRLTTRTGVL